MRNIPSNNGRSVSQVQGKAQTGKAEKEEDGDCGRKKGEQKHTKAVG